LLVHISKTWIWLIVEAVAGGLAVYMATRPKERFRRPRTQPREQKL